MGHDHTLNQIESRLYWNQREPVSKASRDQGMKTHRQDALDVMCPDGDCPPGLVAEVNRLEAQRRLSAKSQADELVYKSQEAEAEPFEAGPSLLLKSCGLSDVKPLSSTSAICRKSVGLSGSRRPDYWRPQPRSIADAVRPWRR